MRAGLAHVVHAAPDLHSRRHRTRCHGDVFMAASMIPGLGAPSKDLGYFRRHLGLSAFAGRALLQIRVCAFLASGVVAQPARHTFESDLLADRFSTGGGGWKCACQCTRAGKGAAFPEPRSMGSARRGFAGASVGAVHAVAQAPQRCDHRGSCRRYGQCGVATGVVAGDAGGAVHRGVVAVDKVGWSIGAPQGARCMSHGERSGRNPSGVGPGGAWSVQAVLTLERPWSPQGMLWAQPIGQVTVLRSLRPMASPQAMRSLYGRRKGSRRAQSKSWAGAFWPRLERLPPRAGLASEPSSATARHQRARARAPAEAERRGRWRAAGQKLAVVSCRAAVHVSLAPAGSELGRQAFMGSAPGQHDV